MVGKVAGSVVGTVGERTVEQAVAGVVVQAVGMAAEWVAGMAVAGVVGTAIERVAEAVNRVVELGVAGWLTCCLPCLNRWRIRSWSRW
jgi:hypothetical protein